MYTCTHWVDCIGIYKKERMKRLLNEKIDYVLIDSNSELLIFKTNNNTFLYQVEAECCSETWIESISNVNNLIGEMVLSVERKQFNNLYIEIAKSEDERECLEIFGYTIKTMKGYTDIEFRNESNGYYGGDVRYLGNVKGIYEISNMPDGCCLIKYVDIDGDMREIEVVGLENISKDYKDQ